MFYVPSVGKIICHIFTVAMGILVGVGFITGVSMAWNYLF